MSALKEAVRLTVVVTASFTGALFAVGALIAAMLEADGFTSAAADGARRGYLLLLAAGLIAAIAIPCGIAAWVYPDRRNAVLATGGAVLAAGLLLFVAAAW